MIEILNNIYAIHFPVEPNTIGTLYFINGEEPALVDTGNISTPQKYLLPFLEKINFPITKINKIILTHNHPDHIGGISEIQKIKNIPVAAFKKELTKTNIVLKLKNNDNIKIGSDIWNIIHTPGHTKDIISIYNPNKKILIASDSFQANGTKGGVAIYTNLDLYLNSIKKIKIYQINFMLLSHPFEPWGKYILKDKEVSDYLDICIQISKKYTNTLIDIFTRSQVPLSLEDINLKFRSIYNCKDSEKLSMVTVKAHLDYMKKMEYYSR